MKQTETSVFTHQNHLFIHLVNHIKPSKSRVSMQSFKSRDSLSLCHDLICFLAACAESVLFPALKHHCQVWQWDVAAALTNQIYFHSLNSCFFWMQVWSFPERQCGRSAQRFFPLRFIPKKCPQVWLTAHLRLEYYHQPIVVWVLPSPSGFAVTSWKWLDALFIQL